MKMKNLPNRVKTKEGLANLLTIAGLIILLLSGYLFFTKTTKIDSQYPIDTDIWSNYGGFVSGVVGSIFSFVGILFLIINLKEQRQNIARQQVETKFFELIGLHRQNLSDFASDRRSSRQAFIDMFFEANKLYKRIENDYSLEDHTKKRESDFKIKCAIAAYLVMFFGVNNNSDTYLEKLIEEIGLEGNAFKNVLSILKEDQTNGHPYNGHQSLLGVYFRHLYQAVTFVNKQPASLFSYDEKYSMVKTLRAQLSIHEQVIFFYNSLSPLGRVWELDKSKEDSKLITKYNLIKNIPLSFTTDIKPEEFYPKVSYEYAGDKTEERKALENTYT